MRKTPSSVLGRALIGLNASRHLSAEQRTGVIASVLVLDERRAVSKALSPRKRKENMSESLGAYSEVMNELMRPKSSATTIENSIGALYLLNRRGKLHAQQAAPINSAISHIMDKISLEHPGISDTALTLGIELVQEYDNNEGAADFIQNILLKPNLSNDVHLKALDILLTNTNNVSESFLRRYINIMPVNAVSMDHQLVSKLFDLPESTLKAVDGLYEIVWRLVAKSVQSNPNIEVFSKLISTANDVKINEMEFSRVVKNILESDRLTSLSPNEQLELLSSWFSGTLPKLSTNVFLQLSDSAIDVLETSTKAVPFLRHLMQLYPQHILRLVEHIFRSGKSEHLTPAAYNLLTEECATVPQSELQQIFLFMQAYDRSNHAALATFFRHVILKTQLPTRSIPVDWMRYMMHSLANENIGNCSKQEVLSKLEHYSLLSAPDEPLILKDASLFLSQAYNNPNIDNVVRDRLSNLIAPVVLSNTTYAVDVSYQDTGPMMLSSVSKPTVIPTNVGARFERSAIETSPLIAAITPENQIDLFSRWISQNRVLEYPVILDIGRQIIELFHDVPSASGLLQTLLTEYPDTSTRLLERMFAEGFFPSNKASEVIVSRCTNQTDAQIQNLFNYTKNIGASTEANALKILRTLVLDVGRKSAPESWVLQLMKSLASCDDVATCPSSELNVMLPQFKTLMELSSKVRTIQKPVFDRDASTFLFAAYRNPAASIETREELIDYHSSLSSPIKNTDILFSPLSNTPMTFDELRRTEWGFANFDDSDADAAAARTWPEFRSLYLRGRATLDHSDASPPSSTVASTVCQTIYSSFRQSRSNDYDWILSNAPISDVSPSVRLYSCLLSALLSSGARFVDVEVATRISEFISNVCLSTAPAHLAASRNIADDRYPFRDELSDRLDLEALHCIVQACHFLENDVLQDESASPTRAMNLIDWFFSPERGMFASIGEIARTAKNDVSVNRALRSILDCLAVEALSKESIASPLVENVRKDVADLIVSVSNRYDIGKNPQMKLLAQLAPCTSFHATEQNILWTEAGSRIVLDAAVGLALIEKSKDTSGTKIDIYPDEFEDRLDDGGDLTALHWVMHCGLVAASSNLIKKKELPHESASNIGNALVRFLLLEQVQQDPKTTTACLDSLSSFARRKVSNWSLVDTKVCLMAMNMILDQFEVYPDGRVEKKPASVNRGQDVEHLCLDILGAYANNPVLGEAPHIDDVNPLIDRMIGTAVDSLHLATVRKDPTVAVSALRVISSFLENVPNTATYQMKLYSGGILGLCSRALTTFASPTMNIEVFEAICLTLQNVFAFQPKITSELCKGYAIESTSQDSVVKFLVEMMFHKACMENPSLATAVIGAYFALIEADPDASLPVSKINSQYPIIARLKQIRDLHTDRVLVETTDALLSYLVKQHRYLSRR